MLNDRLGAVAVSFNAGKSVLSSTGHRVLRFWDNYRKNHKTRSASPPNQRKSGEDKTPTVEFAKYSATARKTHTEVWARDEWPNPGRSIKKLLSPNRLRLFPRSRAG
jgi:hypothetical protein